MGLAAFQIVADFHQEGGGVGPHKSVFPLFGGLVRVQVFQLLGRDKGHMGAVQRESFQLGEGGMQVHFSGTHCCNDGTDHLFQVGFIPVAFRNDLFPVPLVYIDRMEVIQFFFPANSVHVGVQALAHSETIFLQGLTLPFCQTLHYFCLCAGVPHIKGDFSFYAAQIVVQAGIGLQKQRCRNTVQA